MATRVCAAAGRRQRSGQDYPLICGQERRYPSERTGRWGPELRCFFKSRSGGYAAAVDAEVVNNRCPRGRDFTCLKHGGQAGP
jgi:hypothetical protein